MTNGDRGSSSSEAEPRLPRPPGLLRRFWSRHPLFADILIAGVCLVISAGPVIVARRFPEGAQPAAEDWDRAWPVIATVVVLGCFALLVRRRFPVAVFAASMTVALCYLLAPVSLGGPLLGVATYTLAVYRGTRTWLLAVGFGLSTLALIAGSLGAAGLIRPDIAWNSIIGEGITMLIGGLIGSNVGGRKRYVEALIAHSQRLLVERDQQAQLAAAAERERIARELHDIVAHSLTVMVALAEGVAASQDVDRTRPGAEAIAATGRDALRDMRATLGVLRDASPVPFAPIVRDSTADTVASARAAGYDTRLTVTGDASTAPAGTQLAVSRIVQEAVTNVIRHAVAATRIDVDVTHSEDGVTVTVVDDGRPVTAPSHSPGFGLQGVRERVELAGGSVSAGPGERRGWAVRARLPRRSEDDER